MFIKEAKTSSLVSWHQDLIYWGLNDAEEVTAWFALSHFNVASGCIRFAPSSQRKKLVPHHDTSNGNNLLSRGQEVAVVADDTTAKNVILKPGQISLHHGHLIHTSGPNTTNDQRTGTASRYIKPSMKQCSGDKSLAAHVAGEDPYGLFIIAEAPSERMLEANFEMCDADMVIKRQVLYQGSKYGGEDYWPKRLPSEVKKRDTTGLRP